MPEVRTSYRIGNLDANEINMVLAQIANRLDQMEGFRGIPTFQADVDMGGNKGIGASPGVEDTDFATVGQLAQTMTTEINFMTSDVALTLADTFYDGPSLNLTESGTYLFIGGVFVDGTNAIRHITAKLWDGASQIIQASESSMAANCYVYIPLFGKADITSSITIKISAAANGTGCSMKATPIDNNSGCTNLASLLLAIKLY